MRINGKSYLQTISTSERTGCYFGMLTKKSVIMEDLWVYRMVFSLVFLLLMIVIPFSFYIILINAEKPIGGFVSTMNRIAEGDLELTVVEAHRLTELRQLAGAFNHMIRRIQKLKIEKYERGLYLLRRHLPGCGADLLYGGGPF